MRLTLRQLQIFQAVALSGSTTAAADSVALSQSATSAALKELERILQAALFDRVGKRLLLNDTGRALLPAAQAVLDGAHCIVAARAFEDQALPMDLRLFASTTIGNYILPRMLTGFTRHFPVARLQLSIGNTQDVVCAVQEYGADLGLIEGPCHASGMSVIPVWEDELVIVAAPKHPLAQMAKCRKLSAERLSEAQWLLREPGSGTREAVEHALLPHLAHIRSNMTLGSSEAIKYAAAAGLGLSCLSRYVVRDLVAAKRLTVLATCLPRLTRRLALIYPETKVLSNALRRFVAYCERYDETKPA
ncbi:MAG: LysR family transcriptional regulator [Pseudomonadota bacterium]|nr:LysR family transcriptional regulator [Pseudomonadota bacterium]